MPENPDAARTPAPPPTLGVLFVHGMGEQQRGDPLTEAGDVLTEWLRGWLGKMPGADFKIRRARLRTPDDSPIGSAEGALGGQAHAVVTITTKPAGVERREEWVLAESWWAGAFRQATFVELVTWVIAVGPWLIASQRAGIGQRRQLANAPWIPGPLLGSLNLVIALLLTLVAAIVAAVISPLAIVLLLISLIPIPFLTDLTRGIVKNLSGSFGDLLILVRSPIRFAAMAEQVRSDVARLHRVCDRVMVVAHSQGSAIAWHAIRRMADQPADERPEVALFLTYGQAFRKLKSLYLLQRASGPRKFWFAILALASTVFLIVAAVLVVWVASILIGRAGDLSTAVAAAWPIAIWLLVTMAVVVLIQTGLGYMASANDIDAETEVHTEIKAVMEAFPTFRWRDLWASADPAPNGPLLRKFPPGVESHKVRNKANTILDHAIYWSNVTEFASAVAFAAGNLAQPNPLGVSSAIPPELKAAAVLRDQRVGMLANGRVLIFAALGAGLYGLRRELQAWGTSVLDFLQSIPLLPDWFGGWPMILRGFVAAGVITLAVVVVWSVLMWAWSRVTADDAGAFYARQSRSAWTPGAAGWLIAAAGLPILAVAFLATVRGDPSVMIVYAILVIVGLLVVAGLDSPEPGLGTATGSVDVTPPVPEKSASIG